MIKRIIILFFIYLILLFIPHSPNSIISFELFTQKAYAEDVLKINSINFDNSDSIIFIGTSGIEEPTDIKITKQILTEPDRIYFDIDNSILTIKNSTFELKNSKLKQLKIAQNSTNPNIVRIVIWNSDNYDTTKIKVLKIKNNIIIKLNNDVPLQKYLTQIYRETKESAVDYYDKTVIIPEEVEVKNQESDEIFNKVQQAFKEETQELVRPNIEQKQAKLKSRFFLEKATPKNGSLLISGIGVINVEKPFILKEPSRIVFDLPNTIVIQELRDKEFKISETATARIGQFEPSKARVVIKTETPEIYRPVYSTNLQTLLISNSNNLSGISASPIKSELSYFKEQNINSNTNIINIMFSKPIIYSIKREENKINLVIYNLINFNTETFNSVSKSNKTGIVAKFLGTNIYGISIPITQTSFVDCYETLNASQLRLVITQAQEQQNEKINSQIEKELNKPIKDNDYNNIKIKPLPKTKTKNKLNKYEQAALNKIKDKFIIIDPGHGGNDTGAMRGNVLEKDLTLDIALKVKKCLQEKGLTKIIMTRTTDKTLSLEERAQISNNNKADIFVSIHINASVKSEIEGIETHYYSESGYRVAKVLHNELMENVNAVDRGLFKSKFYVINHTEAPAVLLELGFISNEREKNSLLSDERQMSSAKAIADGIVKYLMEY